MLVKCTSLDLNHRTRRHSITYCRGHQGDSHTPQTGHADLASTLFASCLMKATTSCCLSAWEASRAALIAPDELNIDYYVIPKFGHMSIRSIICSRGKSDGLIDFLLVDHDLSRMEREGFACLNHRDHQVACF